MKTQCRQTKTKKKKEKESVGKECSKWGFCGTRRNSSVKNCKGHKSRHWRNAEKAMGNREIKGKLKL